MAHDPPMSYCVRCCLGPSPPTWQPAAWSACCPNFSANACSEQFGQAGFDHQKMWGSGDMGVSENSVPLNPMVLLIIIPIKWQFHWEYTLFSDKPIWEYLNYSWKWGFNQRTMGKPKGIMGSINQFMEIWWEFDGDMMVYKQILQDI